MNKNILMLALPAIILPLAACGPKHAAATGAGVMLIVVLQGPIVHVGVNLSKLRRKK